MNQPAQQATVFSAVAEQSLGWARLVVSAEQLSCLRDGGGDYIANFITPAEETDLLAAVDAAPWQSDLQRRVQHYGYRYDYTERTVKTGDWLGALPPWAKKVVVRLMQKNIFNAPPGQLIVNEYEPGQGIAPHVDRDCFGPVVASLSLGGDCMMRIIPHDKGKNGAFDIVLQRRSLAIFQGKSRDVWRHGIAPRKNDMQNGCKIPRWRRVSLTFRTVRTERTERMNR